ncbi:DHH family phosphoesterase [Candidatus Woesearchaeota archaeon]|jgi:nanoRNase/pAp phosphatase (c-di-AMP/oligoRNAs hydrolase)|nr:DHH family phosphoesterase [Candidatus Woesearchaeota archaeon]MBT4387191.1 DHH family phosphoesterase [Candidatus Woesearchaeota archaeon]MBT4596052.1 DHH family phosphoesterase [Candidatus Woesearchaeota archaeon]MBT5740760.1 DHH family phosphoesterase [Candidatus Woesearchaeota archaeon]MBT6506074.1 DHH family phosphoesterase [Candidatus Woesearchaeota archaeon]
MEKFEKIKNRFEKEIKNSSLKYKIIDENSLKDFLNIIEHLINNPQSNIMLLHDKDADGITSGNIFYYMLKQLGLERIKHLHLKGISYSNEREITKKLINTDVIFSLDLPFSNIEQLDGILSNQRLKKIVIIDHHPTDNLKHPNVILLKSNTVFACDNPARYCTAKLAYDLANLIMDVSEKDWYAIIGIIGDVAYPMWGDFIFNIFKKYNIELSENNNKCLYDSKFGLATELVSCGNAFYPDRVKDIFNALKNSNNLDEFEKKLPFCREVLDEINNCVKNFFNNSVAYDDNIFFYELKSSYHILSQISTIMSINNMDKTIIVVKHVNNNTTFSVRRSDYTINVGSAVNFAASKIKSASGGGHIPAAGAKCDKKDYETFLDLIIHEINSNKYKLSEMDRNKLNENNIKI